MRKSSTKPLQRDDVLRRFGRAVQRCRADSKLTQEQLAELMDVHVTYVSQIERGLKNITLLNIHRLARAVDSSPAELLVAAEELGHS